MGVFIIAEAGVNHNGDIATAKQLIDIAADACTDAVKFQTLQADKFVSRFAPKAEYQLETTDDSESQYEMIKKLELDLECHKELLTYSNEKGIMFLSSPFDSESADMLDSLGLEIFKIPSGEITNLPYLRKIGSLKKEVILSSGMSDLEDIGKALDVLTISGTPKENITVLHCNTEYPTPVEDVNLLAMLTIKDAFDVKIGYSDHTPGWEVPIAAAALGAEVIEKHFTISKTMEGPDHKASLEPDELKKMVEAIRKTEIALGNGIKKVSASELKNKSIARKSIVASKDIAKGEMFTEVNLAVKRPGTGLCPMVWDDVIGKTAVRSFCKDEPIEL